jgi:KDO2-lipid IV(A) lauroyltransferase
LIPIGGILGGLAHLIFIQDRRRAIKNLELAFRNELSVFERKRIVKNIFRNIALNAIDVMRFKKHFHREIKPLIDVEGIEYLDEVYRRGKGVICPTGHIGNFELLAAYVANAGYKVAAIGREIYDKRLNKALVDNRESMNIINIDTRDSPRKMLKLLKDGYILGVLIDTDSFRVRSAFVPAFGRLSWTPIGQSIIGLRSGAGFVPAACVRAGKRYKIIFKPEIVVEKSGDFDQDAYNITKKSSEVWENFVREYKDQWIWMHDRWRTRPKEPGRTS